LSVKIEEKGQQKCNKEIQIERKRVQKSKEHKKIGRAHNKTGEKSTRKRKKSWKSLMVFLADLPLHSAKYAYT